VDEDALVVVDRDALKAIVEYAERRERIDAALTEAV
jgi:hypothetical protein